LFGPEWERLPHGAEARTKNQREKNVVEKIEKVEKNGNFCGGSLCMSWSS
jgi:hypothetical protein